MTTDGAVVHDFFAFHGGGEKVAGALARGLGWDMITCFIDPDVTGFEDLDIMCLEPDVRAPWLRRFPGIFGQIWLFENATRHLLHQRSTVIFSGSLSLFAHCNCRGRKILYCHTPPRLVYDLREFSLAQIDKRLKRLIVRMCIPRYRSAYETAARQMDVILANSDNVRRRIRKYLNLDSRVVYPPVNLEQFYSRDSAGYYLSTGRLIPAKRIVTIVEAFKKMPDQRLLIVSGGEQENEIRRMIRGQDNISCLGWVDDGRLRELLSGCIASIYIPMDEDFGISAVESMASGKPVIGVNEGGLRESVVDGETGLLVSPDPQPEDIIQAVRRLTPDRAARMKSACLDRARMFSEDRFIREIHQYL